MISISPLPIVTNAPLNITFNGTVTLNPTSVLLEIRNGSGTRTLQRNIAVTDGAFLSRITALSQVSEGLNAYSLTAEKFGNSSIPVEGIFYAYTVPPAITNITIQ